MRKSIVILGIVIMVIAFLMVYFGQPGWAHANSNLIFNPHSTYWQGQNNLYSSVVEFGAILLFVIGLPMTIIGFFITPKRREY